MKGLFITFEGNDGSGKSSVIKAVYEKLTSMNKEVILTREPGGSHISEQIRKIILDTNNMEMDPKTEALLYAASRREHLVQTVFPALNAGKIVLSDRYLDSSLVYQGIARKIGVEEVYEMNKFAIESAIPDLTIIITVKPEIGFERIKNNRDGFDRLELEATSFHYQVYEGYKTIGEMYPDRIKMINGEKPLNEVINEVINIVLSYIEG